MLDLALDLEHAIIERAEATGVTPDQFLAKLLAVDPAPVVAPVWRAPTGIDAEAQRAAVLAYINAPQEEIARLHAPHIAYLEAQIARAAKATPEDIAVADAEWLEHKRSMNENRALMGERPVYPDVAPVGA